MREGSRQYGGTKKNTSVILIWLDGGPSHMDLYDMKPDAPAEYRGIWKPIRTSVPGFDITELFPKQAKVTDKFSIVRSLHHDTGDHFAGGHRMLTTKDMGVSGANNEPQVPRHRRHRRPRSWAAPPRHARLRRRAPRRQHRPGSRLLRRPHARRPAQPVPDRRRSRTRRTSRCRTSTWPQGLTHRAAGRSPLAGPALRHGPRGNSTTRPSRRRWTASPQEAFEFVSGPAARRAFDINKEDPKLRDRYGRHNWGQSTLLARRLVEAGSTFVTVHFGGWDHHWDLQGGHGELPADGR